MPRYACNDKRRRSRGLLREHSFFATIIARLGERFDLEQIVAASVAGSGKNVIPKELGWTEYSRMLRERSLT